jgi:hypothetical protein
LKSESNEQSKKIARLEAKLSEKESANKELEAKLRDADFNNRKLLEKASDHPMIVALDNQLAMSVNSFASFGSLGSFDHDHSMDDSYEEDLKHDGESSTDKSVGAAGTASHEGLDLPLAPPPPPPPQHYSTDPCTTHRKKLMPTDASRSSRSKSPGTRKKAKSLFDAGEEPTTATPEHNTVVSTSRVGDEKLRRAKSFSTKSFSSSMPRASSADGARVRRTRSESLPVPEAVTEGEKGSKSAPTTPTKETTRRRLRKGSSTDGMDCSQHSAKSNRSAKSARSASAARRRNGAKLDPLSASSNHSARRRARHSALAEKDRKIVKEALSLFVEEEDAVPAVPIQSSFKKRPQLQHEGPPPATNKSINENKTSNQAKAKRLTTNDFKDLVSSKPMALVQDRARAPEQPRIRPIQSSKWAASA